jgi:single-strand DNA-binding protein
MAASLNKVLLIGNLTRDPELRYLPSGQAVTSFTVAVNRSYVANTGEKKEEVSFIRIVVWARRAEVCNEYLRKGSPVFVEGRLQSRTWEAQDGTKRSSIEVVANNVQFLGRGGARETAESVELPQEPLEEGSPATSKKQGPIEISKEELSPDEEVPF